MKTLTLPAVLFLAGCAGAYVEPLLPAEHPARPDAAAAPATPRENVLAAGYTAFDGIVAAPDAGPALGLPSDAVAPMTRLIDAYLAAGQLLAGDTVAGLDAQALVMDEAMGALTSVSMPDAPHFWHQRQADVETIRDRARALGQAADLPAARIAFGFLSDALSRVLAATGVPAGYDLPVIRFVCGMFAEAPGGGVWLQLGDETRNPYFGQEMLGCHTDQRPVPVTGGTPAAAPPAHDASSDRGGDQGHGGHSHGGQR